MRKIIVSMRFHKEGTNCYSPGDQVYQFITDFYDIREMLLSLAEQLGILRKRALYSSGKKVFIVHLCFDYVTTNVESFLRAFAYDQFMSQDYAELLVEEHWEQVTKQNREQRVKDGYAVCRACPNALSELAGRLPKQIVIDNLDYLSSGTVRGYFGASERMLKHDDWITELHDTLDDARKHQLSMFCNHSDGRHFMDNIYDDTPKQDFIQRLTSYAGLGEVKYGLHLDKTQTI